ncbi:hypothetical protein ACWJJH_17445 [Endozoicomonadaceae bacterium StTr2]
MKSELFVKSVRDQHLTQVLRIYEEMLSDSDADNSSDADMKLLITAWQVAGIETKRIFKKFMHLGAQNSIASFLAHIDTELFLKDEDGELISGDLLDLFWEQEEESNGVNLRE